VRTDPERSQEQVRARAAGVVEHGFAGRNGADGEWVADAGEAFGGIARQVVEL
jgi:hypothetical protein